MILIVSEKLSVSRSISSVVGANATKKCYTEGNGYIVSWCVGHLVGLKYPNDYGNGWEHKWSFSQLPMIPNQWQFTVTESTKYQYNILKKLMNRSDVTEIVCATDAGREGESIFHYVYNMTHCRKPVKRLWVSSLEESAIRQALNDMKPMSASICIDGRWAFNSWFTFYIVYSFINVQKNKNVFRKLNLQGNEIEIFEESDDSYFDKYPNEVLYLFEWSILQLLLSILRRLGLNWAV